MSGDTNSAITRRSNFIIMKNTILFGVLALLSLDLSAQVAAPTFSPSENSDYQVWDDIYVSGRGTIRFTIDGTQPTPPTYSLPTTTYSLPSDGYVRIFKNMTVRAKAWLDGVESPETSVSYRVTGQMAAGGKHSLGLKANGELWGWGEQGSGRLGNFASAAGAVPSPTLVHIENYVGGGGPALSNIQDVSAGYTHSLAVDRSGALWAFGDNAYGQLGVNSTTDKLGAYRVWKSAAINPDYLTNIKQASAGSNFSIALDRSSNVWTFGNQANGRLGNWLQSGIQKYAAQMLSGVAQVAAGQAFGLARMTDSKVKAWGDNGSRQLGNTATASYVNHPEYVCIQGYEAMTGVTETAAGWDHGVAVRGIPGDGGFKGSVWCWGQKANGRLGNTYPQNTNVPTGSQSVPDYVKKFDPVTGTSARLENIIQVAAGPRHTLALDNSGKVWAWGYNGDGNLGTGDAINRSYAVPVIDGTSAAPPYAQLSGIVNIATGGYETTSTSGTVINSFCLAVKEDGKVYTWGYNGQSQLGRTSNATTQKKAYPISGTYVPSNPDYVFSNPVDGDLDDDRLPDWWESIYGLKLGVDDGRGDTDLDGRNNLDEYATGTNPRDITLQIVGTAIQKGPAGKFLTLEVNAKASGGSNLQVEPVRFRVVSGGGKLENPDDLTMADEVTVTYGSGYSTSRKLRYKQGPYGSVTSQIEATLGFSNQKVILTAVTNDLVGWYQFEEAPGNMVVVDSSGTGYNGTRINVTSFFGGIEGAGSYQFTNGSSPVVTIPYSASAPLFPVSAASPFTISMWVKPTQAALTTGTVNFLALNENYLNQGFRFAIASGKAKFWSVESGGQIELIAGNSLIAGKWQHLAVSYTGTSAKLYVDGAEAASDLGDVKPSTVSLKLGSRAGGPSSFINFDGLMDDVRIYSVNKTKAEIRGIMSSAGISVDADTDGMLDSWELLFGFNPNSALDGGNTDTDGDGVPNVNEYLNDSPAANYVTAKDLPSDNQSGPANSILVNPLKVTVRLQSTNAVLAGVPVTFSVLDGTGKLGADQSRTIVVNTDVNGVAIASYRQGLYGSTVSHVQATAGSAAPLVFTASTKDLVAGYKLNESSGVTAVFDSSGTGYDGISSGVISATDNREGTGSFQFNGGMGLQNVYTPNTSNRIMPTAGKPFALSVWIKPGFQQVTGRVTAIASSGTAGANGFRFALYKNANDPGKVALRFWTTENGGTLGLYPVQSVATGAWHHVLVSYSGTSGVMYIDGQQVASSDGTMAPIPDGYWIEWGHNFQGGSTDFLGLMDDIRIYSSAKIKSEARAIMASAGIAVDADADGMLDSWETLYTLNPSSAADGGTTDSDGDGASNVNEYLYDTNPLDVDGDSDHDGASDVMEAAAGTNPNIAYDMGGPDTDGDGVSDATELAQGRSVTAGAAPYAGVVRLVLFTVLIR